MSALSLRLPDSIHRHIEEFAQKEGCLSTSLSPQQWRKNICFGYSGLFAS